MFEHKESKSTLKTLYRITTKEEHLHLLRSAFYQARRTILITSFSIDDEALQDANFYQLIAQARTRGVKIYFYYNDEKGIDRNAHYFLKSCQVQCAPSYTHSKILAVDHNLVALGSFNWLSRYYGGYDGSIVCRGIICKELVEDFWENLIHYRNLQFRNYQQIERFESDSYNHCAISYDIGRNTDLTYLPNLEQHSGFFSSVFQMAKDRLVVCSPFISSAEEFLKDIDHEYLLKTLERGVEIFFVCSAKDHYLFKFKNFLKPIQSNNLYLIEINNFHLKTIIVDNQLIAEGSFNWLSAVRDDCSDFHNHEATLVIEGNMAKELITHFYQSGIGKQILNQTQKKQKRKYPATFFTKSACNKRQKKADPAPQVVQDQKLKQTHSQEEIDLQKAIEASLKNHTGNL